ncbi:hypothetical protein [Reinekea sp.]|jgi:hydroxyacyl-ACP dehydratase HTD2-like protein with hotdog domain|uniref:hypothetical protein n=1 Tax=Reinekea sp. TaxID=1970455 RepID=UPI002A80AE91|nr:hypothetical protein [Reinekea sp.]
MLSDRPGSASAFVGNPKVGEQLPTLSYQVSAPQIFMYSAITWNRHPIHYNQTQARLEGHSDILVQRGLLGNLFVRYLNSSYQDIYIQTLAWKVVSSLTPDQIVQCTATVTHLCQTGWQEKWQLSLAMTHENRLVCDGTAEIRALQKRDFLLPIDWEQEKV